MKKERFVSLRIKLIIGIAAMCLLVGVLAILTVYRIATNIIDKEYSDKAEQVSQAVVNSVDPQEIYDLNKMVMDVYEGIDNVVPSTEWGSDNWNEYIAKYAWIEEDPLFVKIRDHFREYQDIFNVDCVYIVNYRTENMHGIYIVDGDYEEACPPGCCDSYEDGIWPDEKNPVVPATITNFDEYGWLVTAGYPVWYDGKPVASLCVDISMDDIRAREISYVISAGIAVLILTVILLVLSLLYVSRNVIKPVKQLSETAKNYCSENNDVVHHAFDKLEIKTHDEISELLTSMKQMETDMNSNINSLIDTKVALKESQELATKDALTGIRNKTAYDYEVTKLEKDLADGFNEFGLAMVDLNFLKKTNDTYGHEKGNISIRRLCMVVCEVFEHSPVFRIGGDEFIVVLKNRDYRNVDQLILDFNEHLSNLQNDDTLQPWEQISAAIGYYKFDKTVDKTVDDVFKKADKAMYERKTAMKANRVD